MRSYDSLPDTPFLCNRSKEVASESVVRLYEDSFGIQPELSVNDKGRRGKASTLGPEGSRFETLITEGGNGFEGSTEDPTCMWSWCMLNPTSCVKLPPTGEVLKFDEMGALSDVILAI
ncbi:hypothetical protein AVEN_48939-1 [Araneus ventricosus]|uniref:Uncharacterized protein n=1 Tax=Araneus ventricosus TaxID=182803 RepID=A0A4Y2AI90_ARAVE|nr:hypothetical protein AVEN_48939-1 [Araneus ventricosus]